MWPQHRWLKVWAFAEASQKPPAHIAYLRHTRLHRFDVGELALIGDETEALIDGIVKGDYQAAPSYENCHYRIFDKARDALTKNNHFPGDARRGARARF